jgi:hypothetical protein
MNAWDQLHKALSDAQNAIGELLGECDSQRAAGILDAAGDDIDRMIVSLRQLEPDPRDEEYERLAARDRLNGFDRTAGRDWT